MQQPMAWAATASSAELLEEQLENGIVTSVQIEGDASHIHVGGQRHHPHGMGRGIFLGKLVPVPLNRARAP